MYLVHSMYSNNAQGDPGNQAEISFLRDFFLFEEKKKKKENERQERNTVKHENNSNNKQAERGNPWQQLK